MRNATIWVGLLLVIGACHVPSAAAASASASAQVLIIIPDRRAASPGHDAADAQASGDLFDMPQVPEQAEVSVMRDGKRTVVQYIHLP